MPGDTQGHKKDDGAQAVTACNESDMYAAQSAAKPNIEAAQTRRVDAQPDYPFGHLLAEGHSPTYGGALGAAIQNEEKTTVAEDTEGDDSMFFRKLTVAMDYLTNLFQKDSLLGVLTGGGNAVARASARNHYFKLAKQAGKLQRVKISHMIGKDSAETYMDLALRRDIEQGKLAPISRESHPTTLAEYAGDEKGLFFLIKQPLELFEAIETQPNLLKKKSVYLYGGGFNVDEKKYGRKLETALDTARAIYAVSIFKAMQIEPGPARAFSFQSAPNTMQALINPKSEDEAYALYLEKLWTASTLCTFIKDFDRAKKVVTEWMSESTNAITDEELQVITEALNNLQQIVSETLTHLELQENGDLTDASLITLGDEMFANSALKRGIITHISKLPTAVTTKYPLSKWHESFMSTDEQGNSFQILSADPSVLDSAMAPGVVSSLDIGSVGYAKGFFGAVHRDGAPENLAFMTSMYDFTGNRRELLDHFTAMILSGDVSNALGMIQSYWTQEKALPVDEAKEGPPEESDEEDSAANATAIVKSAGGSDEQSATSAQDDTPSDDSNTRIAQACEVTTQSRNNGAHEVQEALQQQHAQQNANQDDNLLGTPYTNKTESNSDILLKNLLTEDKEGPMLSSSVKEYIYKIYQSQLSTQEIMIHIAENAFSSYECLNTGGETESLSLASTQAAHQYNMINAGHIEMGSYHDANLGFAC